MNPIDDKRIVMTLDAGGTNFVFSAIQSNNEIVKPISYPSNAHDLDVCLKTLVDGFKAIENKLPEKPAAISFAFPGPADYPNGIIGDLTNLPAFKGGIALGPMLREIFNIPVFINNDGDLFAYGEYIDGFLPWVNNRLEQTDSPKRYKNLLGITLGTGFGAGIVRNGELYIGDNSNSAEIWLLRHRQLNQCFAEEGVSIRAIQRVYQDNAKYNHSHTLTPKEISDIALGKREGDKTAALRAFDEMAIVLADALANAITLVDGLIVIGGGLSASYNLMVETLLEEMNGNIETVEGETIPRLAQRTYNLQDENQMRLFLSGQKKEIKVPKSNQRILYDPEKRIGIGCSQLGTSKAVNIGAYAFALNELDKK